MSLYPGAVDDNSTLPQPGSGSFTNNPSHAGLHDNEIQAIQALETKLGTGSSTAMANTVLRGTGNGSTVFGQVAVGTDIGGLGTGIATFLGTPTSANLAAAITNETGSGALVFGTSPNIITPTGIVKGDVGLGNVDNTSDATKNTASATLTNKSIDGGSNTLTNIPANALSASAITLGTATGLSSFSTSSTSAIQVTGATCTVVIPSGGRKVRIICDNFTCTNTTAVQYVAVQLWDGTVGSGTKLAEKYWVIPNAGGLEGGSISAIVTPSIGSKTYNVATFVQGGTGGLTFYAGGYLLVEMI